MHTFRTFLHDRPRLAAALCFGVSAAVLTHFAWYPAARYNGLIPALTLTTGGVHAVGGAVTGARLLDASRTRTPSQAAWAGACTFLLALILFAPLMAAFASSGAAPQHNVSAYLALIPLTAVFAFLAAGWALLLLCLGIAVGLRRSVGPFQKR